MVILTSFHIVSLVVVPVLQLHSPLTSPFYNRFQLYLSFLSNSMSFFFSQWKAIFKTQLKWKQTELVSDCQKKNMVRSSKWQKATNQNELMISWINFQSEFQTLILRIGKSLWSISVWGACAKLDNSHLSRFNNNNCRQRTSYRCIGPSTSDFFLCCRVSSWKSGIC